MKDYYDMKSSGIPYVNDIPSHWKIQRGKTILKLLNRPVIADDEVITCFRDGEVTLRKNRREEGFTIAINELGYQGLEPGDLVVHGMDGFAGAIGISDSRGKGSPVLNVIDSNQNKRFLMYYLRSLAYKEVFLSLSTGIRVRSCDLRWNKLATLSFILPGIEEQNKIVSYLDKNCHAIDTLVDETKTSIKEYKKWKASLVFETVTKGLRKKVSYKDSRVSWIGKIPSHWSVFTLYQLATQVKNKNSDLREKNLLSLSYGRIKRKDINTTDGLLPASFNGYNNIEANDIVLRLTDLQNDHTSLRVGLSTERGIITSAYTTLRLNDKDNAKYLYYLLHSYDMKKGFYGMGSGVRQGLNYDEVKELKVILPPKLEQHEIVSYLDKKFNEIDEVISIKESLITELSSYKQSLIYEIVTGKRKVV